MELGYDKNSEDSPKGTYISHSYPGKQPWRIPFMGSYARMRGEMERRVIFGSQVFTGKLKKAYKMEEMIKLTGRTKKERK
jgi:hypothetical protein